MCEYGEFVNLGNWSGTFEETECSAGCLVLRHGETMTENRTMFFEQLPAGQCQEEVQTRAHICIGGDIQVEDEWSGSYKQTMCLDGCGDKPSGELVLETRTRYQMQSGTNECLKQEQVRAGICADGNVIPSSSWSGTYTLEECTHTCVNQFGAKTLVDGFALFSRVRYKEDYPTDACKLEMQYTVQMCTLNGFVPMTPWDGSFTYTTCKDGCGSSSHGQLEQESRERFEDDLPPGPCTSETQVRARLCNEGTLTPWTPWQGDGWEFETCTIGCVTAGLSHGEVGIENRTMFDMDCDEEVQYRSRSCTAGDLTAWTYWNGTYQFATCNEAMSYIDTSVFSEQTSNTQVVNLITIGSTDGSDGIQGLGAGGSTGDAGVTGAGIAFSGTSWGVSGGIVAIAAVAGVGFYKFSKYRKGNADPDENAKKQMQRRLSKRLSLTTSEVQAMPESEMVALHVEPGRRSSYINPLLEHPA